MRHPAGLFLIGLLLATTACERSAPPIRHFPEVRCERNDCRTRLDDQVIVLRFLAPPNALRPFDFEVVMPGLADGVVVRTAFIMPGMEMGRNVYRLQPAGAGRFTARAILPLCTRGRRDWQAVVTIEDATGVREARFAFVVGGEA